MIGTSLGDASSVTSIPLAFSGEPTAGSRVVTTSLLALGLGAARRRHGEIPVAADIFSAEDFVGELDAVVFLAVSSVPGAVRVESTIVRNVPTAKAFTAGPPELIVVVSSREVAALSVSITFSGIPDRADGRAAHGGFTDPFALVDGVGGTRRFSDVLALTTLAHGRAGISIPGASRNFEAALGVGLHARVLLTLGANESSLIPQAGLHTSSSDLSAVGGIRNIGALVEAALPESVVPGARPVGVAVSLVGVLADLTPAEVEVAVPFAGRVGGASRGVAVLGALIVTAGGLSVEDEVLPHVRARDGTSIMEDAILASVGLVGSVGDDFTAVEVGALGRVAADLNVTVVAEGITHAGEGVVVNTLARSLLVDVGPGGRSALVASDVLLGPGFKIAQEGGDNFGRFDGVDVVDLISDSLLVLVDHIPVSVLDVVSVTDSSEEDLTTVLSDGGGRRIVVTSHISPVGVGDEGDDALTVGGNLRENDEVRTSTVQCGFDGTVSRNFCSILNHPIDCIT